MDSDTSSSPQQPQPSTNPIFSEDDVFAPRPRKSNHHSNISIWIICHRNDSQVNTSDIFMHT